MALVITGAGSSGITGSGTINNIPIWTNTTELGDSVLRQVGLAIVVGATDPAAAASETFRTLGGIISDTGPGHDNVIVGRSAQAQPQANARNVVIGTLASTVGVNAIGNVVLGYNVTTPNQGGSVVVGQNITWVNTAGPAVVIAPDGLVSFPGVVIGAGASNGGSGVLVGNQASSAAVNNFVAVGRLAAVGAQYQTILGDNANGVTGGGLAAIVIGANAQSRGANTLTVGALNLPIIDVLIGEGPLSAGAAQGVIWNYSGSQGTDIPGGDIVHVASIGTGAAATGGRHVFQTGTPGVSSFFGQAVASRLEILPAQNANGASVNFLGTTSPGAGAGTIANAPVAGNPTAWIPILFNGAIVAFPAW